MLARMLRGDAALAAALLVVFAGMIGIATGYPRDSRLFPTLVGAAGLAAAALLLLGILAGSVRAPPRDEDGDGLGALPLWQAMLVPPVFGLVLWLLGFWVAAALAAFLVPAMMGVRSLRRRIALALGTVAMLYLLFPLTLDIPLPRGEVMDRVFAVPDDED